MGRRQEDLTGLVCAGRRVGVDMVGGVAKACWKRRVVFSTWGLGHIAGMHRVVHCVGYWGYWVSMEGHGSIRSVGNWHDIGGGQTEEAEHQNYLHVG